MYKFLDHVGATYYNGNPFYYNLPGYAIGDAFTMWGRIDPHVASTAHPNPAEPDGEPCGPGRIHLMRRISARYAPTGWYPWWACNGGYIIGSDDEKVAVSTVFLRRMGHTEFWWRLRRGEAREANLRGADLRDADLFGANLHGANLQWADLREADLRDADLFGANLREANLRGADLREADLQWADLQWANLQWANLCGANLCGADLFGANLRGANLRGADLQWADLQWADLQWADLQWANGVEELKHKLNGLEKLEYKKKERKNDR